jgi:hypothetical protein
VTGFLKFSAPRPPVFPAKCKKPAAKQRFAAGYREETGRLDG